MKVKFDRLENSAKNVKTLWFTPEKSFDYTAGQFVEIYLPHKNADNRGQKRWFTLSSSPSEKQLSISTRQSTVQISSFKQELFALKKGDIIHISEPMGDFVLPKDTKRPIVFVAGGIGITPMRSMIKWLYDTNEKRNIILIYGMNNTDDYLFDRLFARYGIRPKVVTKHGSMGPITGQLVEKLSHRIPEQLIYISGPEPFTEKLEKELLDSGVPKENLVLDFFPGYQLD